MLAEFRDRIPSSESASQPDKPPFDPSDHSHWTSAYTREVIDALHLRPSIVLSDRALERFGEWLDNVAQGAKILDVLPTLAENQATKLSLEKE